MLKCPPASGGGCAGSRCVANGRLSWTFTCSSTSSLILRYVVGAPCRSACSHTELYGCWYQPRLAWCWQRGLREEGRAALHRSWLVPAGSPANPRDPLCARGEPEDPAGTMTSAGSTMCRPCCLPAGTRYGKGIGEQGRCFPSVCVCFNTRSSN